MILRSIALLCFAFFPLSCATYIVPQQSYSGYIGTEAQVTPLNPESIRSWKVASKQKFMPRQNLLIIHQGLDQIPNYRQPGVHIPYVEFLAKLKRHLQESRQFSSVETISQTLWDAQTIEDLRKIGVLHDARYILLVTAQYDFHSFYSSVGHFFGWIPYVNFVVPLYKMEGAARIETWILDVPSGSFVFNDSVSTLKKKRASSAFMREHYRSLARIVHMDLLERVKAQLAGWTHGA